jgi:toxin YoeB
VELRFSDQAWADYQYWLAHDRKQVIRIHKLIDDARRHPHEGIGKPEPLKHGLAGWWSRRIDEEHRMVYKALPDALLIAQLRYHY